MSTGAQAVGQSKHLIDPVSFIGLAVLAGSTRYIKWFDNASLSGLVLSAGLTSGATTLASRLTEESEDKYKKVMAQVAALIAGAVLSNLISRYQTSHYAINLSQKAAGQMAMFCGSIKAATFGIHWVLKKEKPAESGQNPPNEPKVVGPKKDLEKVVVEESKSSQDADEVPKDNLLNTENKEQDIEGQPKLLFMEQIDECR